MKLFDSCEVSSYWPINDDINREENKAVLYMVYYEIKIDHLFYDRETQKYPLYLEFCVRYVKRSSMARSAILRHPSHMIPYAKEELVNVRMDPETRKPLPFPDWWKTHFGFSSTGEKPKHDMPAIWESTEVLVTEYKISFSDVDENGHTNFCTYARLCYDSFMENLYAGLLIGTAKVGYENGLKKLQISFLKESLMGDIMTVTMWTDITSDFTFYFLVKKKGDRSICARVTFIFHDRIASNNKSFSNL